MIEFLLLPNVVHFYVFCNESGGGGGGGDVELSILLIILLLSGLCGVFR